MARPLKPLKVDTVSFRKVSPARHADIYLDRNTQTFFADVGPLRVTDVTADGCRQKAYEVLAVVKVLSWQAYIRVACGPTFNMKFAERRGDYRTYRCGLDFSFFRYEEATTEAGHRLVRPHPEDLSEAQRRDQAGNDQVNADLGGQDTDPKDGQRLPYSAATWATLMDIQAAVGQAQQRLTALAADGSGRLLADLGTGFPLLTAGQRP
jgi:hypothetical protein